MRVLFTTQPGSGHWRPLAPIARRLQTAGHQVVFATTPGYCQYIAKHGFACIPAGVDNEQRDDALSGSSLGPAQSSSVWLNLFVDTRTREFLPDILATCRKWRPDLVIREISEFAGCLAAERCGIPHAAVQISAFRPHLHQLIAPSLNQIRQSLGLTPDPKLEMLYRYLLLSPLPLNYHGVLDLPPTTLAVQNIPFDLDESGLPGWISELPIRPTVYASLGTVNNRERTVFNDILEALSDDQANVIMTVGDQNDPSSFGTPLPHVRIEHYIPQSLVFPYCHAVITHGGFGTITTAIAHGLPMVIIPIAADQPDNARRCATLGAARVIEPDQRSPENIRDAVHDILTRPNYRDNASRLQAQQRSLPGQDSLLGVLEHLTATRQPFREAVDEAPEG